MIPEQKLMRPKLSVGMSKSRRELAKKYLLEKRKKSTKSEFNDMFGISC